MKILFTFFVLLLSVSAFSQISSPGLGAGSNLASWTALGWREVLDSAGMKRIITYMGLGRDSRPDNYNALEHPAIFVLNSEFYHQFQPHWQYSLALSYRKQNQYQENSPYEADSPAYKNEFRVYGRLTYLLNKERVKYAFTFRQEFRKFYTPDFHFWSENEQFRTRLKAQTSIHLDPQKKHTLTFGAEALFKISRQISSEIKWTPFRYDETRLTFFYSFTPKNGKVIYSFGYMDDLVDHKNVSYISFDVVLKNLLKKK